MPIRGLSMNEMLSSRRRDFGDVGAAKAVTFKKGSTIKGKPGALTTAAPDERPWYKRPITYVAGAIVLALLFGPSFLTHGGRARSHRPFGRG